MRDSEKNVAVFFDPHPDDADWWAGGIALLLRQRGWSIHFICVGPATEKGRREAMKSAHVLGIKRHFMELSLTNSTDLFRNLRRNVPNILRRLGPALLFIPSLTDYHHAHVTLARQLFRLFHWSEGLDLGSIEVYAYDSHENRDPIEMYIDISSVWEPHIKSLRCFSAFERASLPENTLIRVKKGRAMMLGASLPGEPVLYAEGYRLLQGNSRTISLLPSILSKQFYFRSPHGLLHA